MKEDKYKECQDCKKVFFLPVSCRKQYTHSCPYCGNWNTAYISKFMYDKYYDGILIQR